MKRTIAVWALPALVALLGGVTTAQDTTPPWFLTLKAEPLDVVTVTYKDGSARSFYYFVFSLTNKSQAAAELDLHVRAIVGTHPLKQKTHVAVPHLDAEELKPDGPDAPDEFVRRLGNAPNLKNVQAINKMGKLEPGESVQGIAVLGTFDREWDKAVVLFTGLESAALTCRVRKYGDAGFTIAHKAYHRHNQGVMNAAGTDAEYTEVDAIVRHDVVWKMTYYREGDEFAPHVDPIHLDTAEWAVLDPKIVMELKPPMSG